MRTLKELLIILRDNARVKKTLFGPRIRAGLCLEIFLINARDIIDDAEARNLEAHMYYAVKNKNEAHPYRLCNHHYLFPRGRWRCRKRWLNKQIKQLN